MTFDVDYDSLKSSATTLTEASAELSDAAPPPHANLGHVLASAGLTNFLTAYEVAKRDGASELKTAAASLMDCVTAYQSADYEVAGRLKPQVPR